MYMYMRKRDCDWTIICNQFKGYQILEWQCWSKDERVVYKYFKDIQKAKRESYQNRKKSSTISIKPINLKMFLLKQKAYI